MLDKQPVPKTLLRKSMAFAVAAVMLLLTAMAASHYGFPLGQQRQLQAQIMQQQQAYSTLTDQFSEAEAKLALRQGQIDAMKQEMKRLHLINASMQVRLEMFDDVLASRKVPGIHFLRTSARWNDDHSLSYQLILVKGENYPRWIKGHLSFTAIDADGHARVLNSIRGKTGHKVEMTTHAFIEGTLACSRNWQPETLRITLINHLGRNKGSIEVPITSAQQQTATERLP